MKRLIDYVNCEYYFHSYRDGSLIYHRNEDGFKVFVPVKDINQGTLESLEKGVTLMKWIRRALEEINNAKGST